MQSKNNKAKRHTTEFIDSYIEIQRLQIFIYHPSIGWNGIQHKGQITIFITSKGGGCRAQFQNNQTPEKLGLGEKKQPSVRKRLSWQIV